METARASLTAAAPPELAWHFLADSEALPELPFIARVTVLERPSDGALVGLTRRVEMTFPLRFTEQILEQQPGRLLTVHILSVHVFGWRLPFRNERTTFHFLPHARGTEITVEAVYEVPGRPRVTRLVRGLYAQVLKAIIWSIKTGAQRAARKAERQAG